MIRRQYFDRESSTYTYLIADPASSEAALIDPVLERTEQYLKILEELGLSLKFVLDTHTHADHISAAGELRRLTSCKTVLGAQSASDCVDVLLRGDETLDVGELELKALYTPGHTDDSYCFELYVDQRFYLFTGDTLLIRGTGRTDFQNGNAQDQYQSLTDILLKYPDDAVVFPGHDYNGCTQSTIGEERRFNPRLQVVDANAYRELMDALNLPDPKLMDIAVPANQACGDV